MLRPFLLSFAPVLLTALSGAQSTGEAIPAASGSQTFDPAREAARRGDVAISWDALEETLVDRFGNPAAERGQGALTHLARAALLRRLAQEGRVEVTPAELDARVDELARQTIESGQASSLAEYLELSGVSERAFRELLELSLVQERLSRKALGIPDGREVAPELQERWLDEIIGQRGGMHYPEPPWKDGVVARLGDLAVTESAFRTHLRWMLPAEDVRAACRHLLLVELMRQSMPDLNETAIDRAIAEELGRRRELVRTNEKYKGLAYEQLMAARGSMPGRMARDPELIATALAGVWVDRKYSSEALQAAYREERAYFDGHFGEALDLSILYLTAAVLPNQLNPRSFEDARLEIVALARQASTLAEFQAVVGRHSEDPTTKARGGALGWLTKSGEGLEQVRAVAFSIHAGGLKKDRRRVGPIDLPSGVAMCWVQDWRPAPDWETMREHVTKELRRRFVDELCPPDGWTTYLDRP